MTKMPIESRGVERRMGRWPWAERREAISHYSTLIQIDSKIFKYTVDTMFSLFQIAAFDYLLDKSEKFNTQFSYSKTEHDLDTLKEFQFVYSFQNQMCSSHSIN